METGEQSPRRGRPVCGAELVDRLGGSPHARERALLILQTISGQITIARACEQLGICESAFHKLRTRTLEEMVAGLEPRPVGRPGTPVTGQSRQIEQLAAQVAELQAQLQAARVREELALAGLLGRPGSKKKNPRRR